jgi:hypothetical protein
VFMIIRYCSRFLGSRALWGAVRPASCAEQCGGGLADLGGRGDAEVGEPGRGPAVAVH